MSDAVADFFSGVSYGVAGLFGYVFRAILNLVRRAAST